VNAIRRGCAVLLVSMLASGCAVDQANEVATYRDVLDAGLTVADVSADEPLTLAESMRLAALSNESIALEGERYLQAIIARRRAVAAFLPTISLAPSYRIDSIDGEIDDAFDVPVNASISTSFVSDYHALDAAGAEIGARRALLFAAQDTLLLDVARTHYEVIRAERAVDVLETSLAVQNERVADARARLEVGLVRPLDLSLSEAQTAQTAADLEVARNRVLVGRAVLAYLTAAPIGGRPLVDSLEQPAALPSLESWIADAERGRPELLAASRTIDTAERRVQSAYGQYYPTVSLDIQGFLHRDTVPTDLDWLGVIRVTVPLFSAGLIEADVRDALSFARQAKLFESLTRRATVRDITTALDSYGSAAQRATHLAVQVRASRDALEQSEGLYQVGLATNLERLTAQDQLQSAELQLVSAELESKVSYLDLLRTSGSLHTLIGLTRELDEASPDAPGDSSTREHADATPR